MVRVTMIQTWDGKMFQSEKEAESHEQDLIAEELEEIISKILQLDCTHRAKVAGILQAVGPKREHLRSCVRTLHAYLEAPKLEDEDDNSF